MLQSKQLRQAFSKDNLHRAWRWLQTNPDARYKEYYRHIYTAYGEAIDDNLKRLRKQLLSEHFKITRPSKIYFPKKSGVLRMYTLIAVEDQIVYQALLNVIAEKCIPRLRNRYNRLVFGNLYSGKNGFQFYENWKELYSNYISSFVSAYKRGYDHMASFDLTAFYDSIDHTVLLAELKNFGLEPELCSYLGKCLSRFTESQYFKKPIHHGHGIPQGPLSSGLLGEIMLARFDALFDGKSSVRYLRYVDDIRLLGKTESAVRRDLVRLDLVSKALGLFPQSNKIDLRQIKNIKDEIKSVSTVTPGQNISSASKQTFLRKKFQEVTKRHVITDETKMKFLLSQISPNHKTTEKVIKLLTKYPHLYKTFINYLEGYRVFSRKVSKELLEMAESEDVYFSFTANLLRLLRDRHHYQYKRRLEKVCKIRLKGPGSKTDAEMRAYASSSLIKIGAANWTDMSTNTLWVKDWWVRTYVQNYLEVNTHGAPNVTNLVNTLLTDEIVDPATVAAARIIQEQLPVSVQTSQINISAQTLLKKQKVIKRYSNRNCFVSKTIAHVLATKYQTKRWKKLLDNRYDLVLSKMPRWSSTMGADSTGWIMLTDSLMDILIDRLTIVHTGIGSYQMGGNLGGYIYQKTSRFAKAFPNLRDATVTIHDLRLEADLAHPVVSKTGARTRYVPHREAKNARMSLIKGLDEMWQVIDPML